jgi:hypothetical protein
MRYVKPQTVYDVKARRISGTRDEKLEQIDMAIQELLDIKALECAGDNPNVRFLAVPRPKSHSVAMTVTVLLVLAALLLLLGVRTSHAQDAPASQPAWHAGAFLDVGYKVNP